MLPLHHARIFRSDKGLLISDFGYLMPDIYHPLSVIRYLPSAIRYLLSAIPPLQDRSYKLKAILPEVDSF
jgi:hypothetical protein